MKAEVISTAKKKLFLTLKENIPDRS